MQVASPGILNLAIAVTLEYGYERIEAISLSRIWF